MVRRRTIRAGFSPPNGFHHTEDSPTLFPLRSKALDRALEGCPQGGVTDRVWHPLPTWDQGVLPELFEIEVFRFLRARELLSRERMELILSCPIPASMSTSGEQSHRTIRYPSPESPDTCSELPSQCCVSRLAPWCTSIPTPRIVRDPSSWTSSTSSPVSRYTSPRRVSDL